MRKETCKCGKVKERRHAGSCNACHNTYSMEWRKNHPFTIEQKEDRKKKRIAKREERLQGIRQRRPRLGAKPGILRPLCSWCDSVIEDFKKKTFCKPCSAKYNREWRKKNPPSPEQKHKDNVRVKTYHLIRKGVLVRKPCEICGELKVEGHHDDYNKPFQVRWLCVKHHHEFHRRQRRLNGSVSKDNEPTNS